jgi:protein phosphatase
LLKPRGWKPPTKRQFFLDCNEIADLCNTAERLFSQEPSVLQIRAPVKIFGDLHGQFGDLMRLFDEYGSPSTAGDITYVILCIKVVDNMSSILLHVYVEVMWKVVYTPSF